MRHCIDELNESRFQGRPLRIKKAVEPKRLEKKQRRK
jgi:RNA recognition motif-containing protein